MLQRGTLWRSCNEGVLLARIPQHLGFCLLLVFLSVCWLVPFAGGHLGPCANVNFSAFVCGLTVLEPLLTGRVITVAVTTKRMCNTVAGGATLSPATSCFDSFQKLI
ncbi:hypothetical protein TcCL_ESM08163 [Trypanosoma cruzi]|nr:hypothetical protein TcCL_ESM08163 [Trypanosoma cruzi]